MKFDFIAGTGGIGKGEVFKLIGNHTLGREESRSAVLTDFKDYCKAHIILSYVARLCGEVVPVYAIGKVGNDARDKGLIEEMNSVNINTEFVEKSDLPTMYSVCFLYENGNGGNITTCNDACSAVTGEYLITAIDELVVRHGSNGMFLAAPEVALKERFKGLIYAKNKGIYTVASVLTGEAEEFIDGGYAKYCDLLAVNEDEITALGKGEKDNGVKTLLAQNIALTLIVTEGKKGAKVYSDGKVLEIGAVDANVVSTAGAGDALLGGTIYGLSAGYCVEKAVTVGSVCSSFAVQSPHNIPSDFTKQLLNAKLKEISL